MMRFNITTVAVAIERPDASIAVMRFVVTGRNAQLPSNAEWTDEKLGLWMRFASNEAIESEVRKTVPEAVRWQRITESILPGDRTYRNALRFDMSHDMPKARAIHRDIVRHERARVLPELDGKWMRAMGQGKQIEAAAIEAERQRWRDAPADPRIDSAANVEALRVIGGH